MDIQKQQKVLELIKTQFGKYVMEKVNQQKDIFGKVS
jgi:hypothetical protein